MTSDPLAAVRYLDVVLVVAAAPFVLLTGLPALGYLVGAAAWIATRVAALAVERRAAASDNPKTVAGLTLFTGLGRAWLLGLTILVVGLVGEREDGLTAAILIAAAFTTYLITGIATRPQRRKPSNP
ncbi:MAG: hypothetical protein QOG11_598 [Solirubrobacteraceae bacterium]|nr:hypothetical protein [Solirubrobacteraceae bacterium]